MQKKRNVAFIVAVVLSLIFGGFFASLMGNNIKECAKDMIFGHGQKKETKTYEVSDMQFVDYKIEGDTFETETDDPQIILSGINDYVKNITIHFGDKIQKDVILQIYYSSSAGGFTPDQMYTENINKGSETVTFDIERKVSDLRMDIGTEKGIQLQLENMVVNDDAKFNGPAQLFQAMISNFGKKIGLERTLLLSLFFMFLFVHFLVDIKKMYNFIFEKRWIIAGILLIFLVCNRYNGDSIAMYDYYVQPGEGNEYIETVLGKARAIRSDEWLVDTPVAMSSRFLDSPYGRYNTIIRGTRTLNGGFMSFSSISSPLYFPKVIITKVLGYDYGVSFGWYGNLMLVFLFLIEFFMILTNKNRLLSVCGTCMVFFSSFFLWWGFPSVFLGASASLTCAYHFVNCKDWRKKIFFALGTSIFTANFVLILYPAWQVPVGYMVIAILIYLIHDNWQTIKSMSKLEWLTIVLALILCISIIISYMLSRSEYMNAIMQTEYPGSRIDYGGFSINKLFNYIPAVLFAYKNYGNPSEAGTCIGLFPLPMLLGVYVWIRSRKKDWLITGLLLVGAYLLWYTTVGLPHRLAVLTMMTYTTSGRAVDMLGFLQIVLLLRVLTVIKEEQLLNMKAGCVLAGIFAVGSVVLANHFAPGYMGKIFMVLMAAALAFIVIGLTTKVSVKWRQRSLALIIVISLITGVAVRPVNKGTDAITSKPLAKEITKIVKKDKDAKWFALGGGVVLPSFAVACGAPTLNSVNTYPNMELWKKLDPTGKYNEVYNRYAHIDLQLTDEDTSMELIQADSFRLKLSYKDIKKTEAEYVVSQVPLDVDSPWVSFKKIYDHSGCYIYKINY